MGGGVNYPTLIRIQHYCTQIFHNQKERTQKNLKLLSKLYCRPLKGIEVNWHTYREKRQLLNKTWTSRPFPSLENKNSGFLLYLPYSWGSRSKLHPPFAIFQGNVATFSPRRWHLENGKTLAMFCFKESWHGAAQSLWIAKEFVPIILKFVRWFDDPAFFFQKAPYTAT